MSETPKPGKTRMRAPERREAILDAATATFARLGYRAAGMADIAEAAEITQPMLYRHFSSKKELYLECLDRAVAAIMGALRAATDLAGMGVAYAQLSLERPELVRLRLQALTETEEPEIRERFRTLFLGQFELIRAMAAREASTGNVDPKSHPEGLPWLYTALGMLNDVVVAMSMPDAYQVVDLAATQFWNWNDRAVGREQRNHSC